MATRPTVSTKTSGSSAGDPNNTLSYQEVNALTGAATDHATELEGVAATLTQHGTAITANANAITGETTARAQGDAATLATIRGGVASDGDTLAKLRALISGLSAIVGGSAADPDSIVNTVTELLAVFATYSEGVDIATLLNSKVAISAIVDNLTSTNGAVPLSAAQGKALKTLLDGITSYTDAALVASHTTQIATETTNRTNADTALQNQLNATNATVAGKEAAGTAAALDTALLATIRDGVAGAGDTLAKQYALIQAINAIIGGSAADPDFIVNTVTEILSVFATYPEGMDLLAALAGKVATADVVNTLTQTAAGKVLDARQGAALKALIDTITLASLGGSAALTPTATKTTAYTAAIGELALMNVPGGGAALTLPAAPADKAQVGYRAIGATTAVPLVVTAGGTDTIGTAGATSAGTPMADEIVVLQYQASAGRWLAVSNVKTMASLDARYRGTWNVRPVTTAATAANNDYLLANTSGGTYAVAAPAPVANGNWGLKWIAGTVPPTLSGTFNSAVTISVLDQAVELISDGTTWYRQVRPSLAQLPDYPAVTDARYGAGGAAAAAALARRTFGLVLPAIKAVSRFYNEGSALATAFVLHPSGTGLASPTEGTVASGYLPLSEEVNGVKTTRLDVKLKWDATQTGASIDVVLGDAGTGYKVTIANSGANVVVTFPSGATVSGPLAASGTVDANVSFATGNGGITCSFHVLGTPTSLATATNPYRVPVYEFAKCTKPRLLHLYLSNNSAACRVTGLLFNAKGWDGDPGGQLLTRTVLVNASGNPGNGDGLQNRDNNSLIVLPERATPASLLKVAHFFHGRTQVDKAIIDLSVGDAGETARQLLLGGYALISSTGGYNGTVREADWWGNPTGLARCAEVYDELIQNTANVGKEYLVGWSMGGTSAANYLRQYGSRIGAVWLSCPALDLEESGSALAVQVSSALKSSLDNAYMSWYVSLVAANTADPQTDTGTNWRQIATPGGVPQVGFRNYTLATVSSAVTASTSVPTSAGTRFYPGDTVHFKYSGQTRRVVLQATGQTANINVDAPVTLVSGEPIAVLRPDGRFGSDYTWMSRPTTEWTASTQGAGAIVLRKSANLALDVRPHNPARHADVYAELGVPFRLYVGGVDAAGNDGILNNAPMYAFRDAVNALTPGLVTLTQTTGNQGHLSAGTLSATDTKALFDAN